VIGYQSIFPKQGTQTLTMGDVVFNYEYEKSSYEIDTNTSIEVYTKKSSGHGGGGSFIPVTTPTAPVVPVTPITPTPVIPTLPVIPPTKPTST